MIILSIHTGHGAAVGILRDGELLLNLERERFDGIGFGHSDAFIGHCLTAAGLSVEAVDLVCMNGWGDPAQGEVPATDEADIVNFQAKVLGRDIAAYAINRHLAFAAGAYYTSPFDEAAVFTFDGAVDDAENAATAVFRGNELEFFKRGALFPLPRYWAALGRNNYGLARSAIPALAELAAQGKRDDGLRWAFHGGLRDFAEELERSGSGDIAPFSFNGGEDLSDTQAMRSRNVAFAMREMAEGFLRQLVDGVAEQTGLRSLCYAGDMALAPALNARIVKGGRFKALHVPPCPDSGGLALGMALLCWHQILDQKRNSGTVSPYAGPVYAEAELDRAIAWGQSQTALTVLRPAEGELAGAVAALLAGGQPIALWRQRSESGPRPLGHRAILARADGDGIERQPWYRIPDAILSAEQAPEMLFGLAPCGTIATVRPQWRDRLAAVTQADYNVHAHILKAEDEPFLHALVGEMPVPALACAGLCVEDRPVETPVEAMRAFVESAMRVMVLHDRIVSKQGA